MKTRTMFIKVFGHPKIQIIASWDFPKYPSTYLPLILGM